MPNVFLKSRGLQSFPHQLLLPEGALLTANNVIINRDNVVEPRRGFALYGNSMGASATTDNAKQLLLYKERILRHYQSTLQYDNGSGTFASFTGTFAETESGLRIKGKEINSNFYFTTNSGIKKISAANAAALSSTTITNAGGIKALDVQASLNDSLGFFTQESVVAYRIVWGIKDSNNNLILGSPSERVVIYNPITDLLTTNFNNLLSALDGVSNSGGINDANYLTSLKVSLYSSAATLRTNLLALATKIDDDTVITEGAIGVATTQRVSATSLSIVFDTDVSTFLEVGDVIRLSSSTTSEVNSNNVTITSVSTTTVVGTPTINYSGTDGSPVADTGASVKRLKYTLIASPSALSTSPTTAQLESLQTYYDAIVTGLQGEPVGIITSTTPFDTASSTQSSTVSLTFTIPTGVTTSHFYQIYRTVLSTSSGTTILTDLDPGDECKLAQEANPTSAEITAKEITYVDITPESFLGANLYTNPNSGEGILKANEVPPLAKDIELFKGYTFYANTQTKYRKQLNLLSISELISGTSTFTITDGTTTNTYTFVTPVSQVVTITCVAGSAYTSSGPADYFDLYSAENETKYRVWFNSGTATAPSSSGVTLVEIAISGSETANEVADEVYAALNVYNDFIISNPPAAVITVTNAVEGIATAPSENVADAGFAVAVTVTGVGEDAANKKVLLSEAFTPSQQVDETARSLCKVINKQAGEIVNGFYLSGQDDVPGIFLLEARSLGGNAFYLNVNSTATGSQFTPDLPTSGNSEIADNETAVNRIYYSKNGQPEAVPILNYIPVGPKDKAILRIIALRDSLFIFKEEAIYRLSGESEPFIVTLFDSSSNLIAPDTADVLNNQIYCFTTQGVAAVSDTGVSIISRPIENHLIKLTTPSYTNFSVIAHGRGYESDRSYYLWLPKTTSDTYATQCFIYNTFTSAWTISTKASKCSVINTSNDKMYIGAGDINFIEQERKNFDRTDHADREISVNIGESAVNNNIITLDTIVNVSVGDVFVQTQYLTIAQLNRLLKKLDADNGVTDTNYFSTLGAEAGDNLRNILTSLATKLDADTGVSDSDYASTISAYTTSFSDTQDAFNDIVTKLNADTGVIGTNYLESSGTVIQEVVITNLNKVGKKITTKYAYPFIVGPATVYNHFICEVEWAPQTIGDPSVSKHFSEGTFIFENNNFTSATVAFASDLDAEFQEITFNGVGNGSFGNNPYGTLNTFGGSGSNVPFRTYIPRNKQRCRYIKCKFKHSIARESFALYGGSLVVSDGSISHRAYKTVSE